MQRTYTAEQIADIVELMCRDEKNPLSEEARNALIALSSFFLNHSKVSYDELRVAFKKEKKIIEARTQYPPFREENVATTL